MVGASLAYAYDEQSEASLWLHHIDKLADILYGEVNGVWDLNEAWHLDYGLQAAHIVQRDASHVDGDVYGVMLITHYNDFFMGAASNFARVDAQNHITDGFGGGPYFTSLDEATIAFVSEIAPGVDVGTYRFCGIRQRGVAQFVRICLRVYDGEWNVHKGKRSDLYL